ncbi:hypothetical protein [Carboxydothermus islandicus]|uniref:hypothetical protein n=1 Tax=Carboxydothermus islandicus TaxID=661089 RepID=UPI00096AB601|nr:hypothetical protein [Carboxydothermus islandicus]
MNYPRCFLGQFPGSNKILLFLKVNRLWYIFYPDSAELSKPLLILPRETRILDSLDFLIESYRKIFGQPVYFYLTPESRRLWPYLLKGYREISLLFYYKPIRKTVPYIALGELSGLKLLTQNSPKPYAYFTIDF